MCALAGLAARAAAQVGALEARAPALAAAATCPLQATDLADPSAVALLAPIVSLFVACERGLTLQEARLIYMGTGAAVTTLASTARRIVGATCLPGQGRARSAQRLCRWLTLCGRSASCCRAPSS